MKSILFAIMIFLLNSWDTPLDNLLQNIVSVTIEILKLITQKNIEEKL